MPIRLTQNRRIPRDLYVFYSNYHSPPVGPHFRCHLYIKGTPEARELVESSLSGLFMNEFDEVISDLESINPGSPEVAEKIINLINYLISRMKTV